MVAVSINNDRLEELCRRWGVVELALFGSVLRADFGEESDVDVLVTYANDSQCGLFEHMRLEEELSRLLGRRVDLVSRRGLAFSRNVRRRDAILNSAERIYVS